MMMLTWLLVEFIGKIGSTGETTKLVSTAQVLIRGLQACWVSLEGSISVGVILVCAALRQLVEV